MSTFSPRSAAGLVMAELKANPRLRWGAWLIVAIVGLYAVLLLRDEANHERESYRANLKKVERVKSLAAESEWPARLERARSVQQVLENRLWRESTIGLAQASFEDWLTLAAKQAGLAKLTIAVASKEESGAASDSSPASGAAAGSGGAPGAWKVSARLAFDFRPETFHPFLAAVSAHEKAIFVDSLVIRGSPTARVDLVLVAFFKRPLATPGTASTATSRSRDMK